jgi:hypothetical protein
MAAQLMASRQEISSSEFVSQKIQTTNASNFFCVSLYSDRFVV